MVIDNTNVKNKLAIGKILVTKRFITNAQLAEALKVQREKNSIKIGDLMVSLGYLSDEQLDIIIKKQKNIRESKGENLSFGAIVLKENFVSKIKLEKALKIQNRQYCAKLGDTLLEMGYITPEQLAVAIKIQDSVGQNSAEQNSVIRTEESLATIGNINKNVGDFFASKDASGKNRAYKIDKVVGGVLKILMRKKVITKDELLAELGK